MRISDWSSDVCSSDLADIPAARMNSIDDLLQDEHLLATGFVRQQMHPTEGLLYETGIPTEWSKSPPSRQRPAPGLGEHTYAVLAEFDFSAEQISALRQEGVMNCCRSKCGRIGPWIRTSRGNKR